MSAGGARGHVLLVEDEVSILSALSMLMEMEDLQVVEATDGRQGLAALSKARPDVIITDFMMPFMNGAEMVRQIRAVPDYQSIPIILISAVEAAETGVADLIDAYLRKPPNLDQLFDLVERAMRSGREGLRLGRPTV